MKWFTGMENINWTRLWWVVGVICVFWTGLVTLMPMSVYKPVAVILAAAQGALLFAARGNKYVANRTEPPADGKP
jgi:hypothetical protein